MSGERIDTGWILILFFIIVSTDAKVDNYPLTIQFGIWSCIMRTILYRSYCLWITNKIIVFYRRHTTYWATFILNTFTTIDAQAVRMNAYRWTPNTECRTMKNNREVYGKCLVNVMMKWKMMQSKFRHSATAFYFNLIS